jgi:hypothetical protein
VAKKAKSTRSLCKWSSDEIAAELATLREIIGEPRFVCGKCARAAARKKHLCRPVKLGGKQRRRRDGRRADGIRSGKK